MWLCINWQNQRCVLFSLITEEFWVYPVRLCIFFIRSRGHRVSTTCRRTCNPSDSVLVWTWKSPKLGLGGFHATAADLLSFVIWCGKHLTALIRINFWDSLKSTCWRAADVFGVAFSPECVRVVMFPSKPISQEVMNESHCILMLQDDF